LPSEASIHLLKGGGKIRGGHRGRIRCQRVAKKVPKKGKRTTNYIDRQLLYFIKIATKIVHLKVCSFFREEGDKWGGGWKRRKEGGING